MRLTFSILLTLLALNIAIAQQKIELIHANSLLTLQDYGADYQFLRGQVILQHDSSTIFCDSAIFNTVENSFRAFRRVRIVSIKGIDTMLMSCDSIFYFGDSSYAYAYGHIKMEKDSIILFTDTLEYDFKNSIAYYDDGGLLVAGNDTLISKKAVYYTKERKIYFSDSVRLWDDKYKITSDTLIHDFRERISFLLGPTYIYTDSNTIYCTQGAYYHKTNQAEIQGQAQIKLTKQTIYADKITYNKQSGYGEAYGSVKIIDTSDNYILTGQFAKFNNNTQKFHIADDATLLQYSKEDTFWIRSDTFFVYKDTLIEAQDTFIFRRAIGYNHVKAFNKSLQLKCDSIVYSMLDSTIYMYGNPVLWSDSIQLYADFAQLTTVNDQPYQLILKDNAFLAEHTYDDRFNQIFGKDITIWFKNKQIKTVDVLGNAQSIYYIFDDTTLIAINKLACDTIKMFFNDKKLKGLKATGTPSGRIIPPSQATQSDLFLDNFKWYGEYRPLKPEDIYIWKRE